MKVRHFRNKNYPYDQSANHGVVTVIYGDHKKYGSVFSVSFCSPKDQFNKKLGRKIAEGRFAKNRLFYDNKNVRDNLMAIMYDEKTPSWAWEVLESNVYTEDQKDSISMSD